MSEYTIEIPAPIITCETQWLPATMKGEVAKWLAEIKIAGVTIMERTYLAEWGSFEKRPANFAWDGDEAQERILKEFGEKLKKLLEV